jgi:hypothetical protein
MHANFIPYIIPLEILPLNHLLLNSAPNLGPLISR